MKMKGCHAMRRGLAQVGRLALLPVLCSLLLSGCWDRIEVNDLAIVLATGIDYADNKVQLTAQFFIPRKAGTGSGGSGSLEGSPSGVTMTRTAEGITIAEALNRLQRKVSRNVFWGHCEVLVISKAAGKHGLREFIDFLLRYPQFREHAYVFSAGEDAKSLLELLPPLERSSAESLREMGNLKLGTRITVLELAQSIEGPSRSVILTQLLRLPPEPGQNQYASDPFVRGLSLYKNDRYIKTIDEPLTIGVLMLANELNNIIMPTEVEDYKGGVSIRPINMRATMNPQITGGKWKMKIHIESEGEVVLNTTDMTLSDAKFRKVLEKAWEKKLEGYAQMALHMAQKQLKTDFFKFAVEFRRHYPKQWLQNKANWEQIFPQVETEISVRTVIVRTGKSTEPQGIPDQEDS
ncbi:Ger(x)C family spore germination protein [Paenibacillus sp. SYP-B4298]|uniref:Ger(x)C family spore germination protein n=1 Tax=Paenibacillus sp. SYP-B4298 TaxID=2996034 RepID=UPI0022DD4EAC|nr:Ger(x)C family spore germination protein [Paenibacillus sp. SYP-B4298]